MRKGLSSRRTGDELIGLTRSLLYAGAPSALVSLWKVDDNSTGLLMHFFYTELLAGASKAEALRSAQRAVMQTSIREAIAYCEEAKHYADQPDLIRNITSDIAQLQYLAGDFNKAAFSFDQAAVLLDEAESLERRELLRNAARSRARQRETDRRSNYERRPYVDPYYWAPFVLVGDWR